MAKFPRKLNYSIGVPRDFNTILRFSYRILQPKKAENLRHRHRKVTIFMATDHYVTVRNSGSILLESRGKPWEFLDAHLLGLCKEIHEIDFVGPNVILYFTLDDKIP